MKFSSISVRIGYTKNEADLINFSKNVSTKYFEDKEIENLEIHETIVNHIDTVTNHEVLNSYFNKVT